MRPLSRLPMWTIQIQNNQWSPEHCSVLCISNLQLLLLHKTQEKCQNPPCWRIPNVPKRYKMHCLGLQWTLPTLTPSSAPRAVGSAGSHSARPTGRSWYPAPDPQHLL